MINANSFAAVNKASVETLSAMSRQAAQRAEQLAALNLQAIKTSLAEGAEIVQGSMSAKNPQAIVKLHVDALQAAPKKAAAYGRQVKQIFATAATEQRAAAEARMTAAQAKFLDAVNGVLKNAPGSEKTLALVKSAIAAGNNTYKSIDQASKRASDAVEANVEKFTETMAITSRSRPATIDA